MSDPTNSKAPAEYKVDDQELLLDVYKRLLWDRLIPHIPHALAPNAITIMGQIAGIVAVACTFVAVNGGHPVLFVVSAFMLLAYLTADNVDGAHARRTGRSSPLGEFLDHGLDGIASGAVLVTAILVLRADPISGVLITILGAIGFVMVFWEQFRTGILVIPKVSSTEGVTLLMLIQLVVAFAGDPAWLHFSADSITAGTVIIVALIVGYAAAMAPPVLRAAKRGVSSWELLPLGAVAGSFVAYPILGGEQLIPAIAVGIFGADVVCRMIVLRHRGETGPLLSAAYFLIVLPLLGAVAAPDAWSVTGWSSVALTITAILYARTMFKGISELLARMHGRDDDAELRVKA